MLWKITQNQHNFHIISICWMCFEGAQHTVHDARRKTKKNKREALKKE
jgi:hypothetical protein